MSSTLRLDTAMEGEDRYQLLLARKAQIDAELASFNAPPSSHQHHHRVQKQQSQRRRDVPRSMNPKGTYPMARHQSYDRIEVPKPQLSRSLSQRSAPSSTHSMARTNSKGNSSQGSGNLPFTSNGRTPTPLSSEPQRDSLSTMPWTSQGVPVSEYTFTQSPQLQRSISQRGSELGNIGEDPAEYLVRTIGAPSISIPASTPHSHRLSISSYGMQTPSTPATIALTDATTFTGEMSRQNSLLNDPFIESVQMMKVDSSLSCSPYVNFEPVSYDELSSSRHHRRSSTEEQSQLLIGAGAHDHESLFSHSFQVLSSSPMLKSTSSSSSSSSKSSRNAQRLQDQINAARPIMPKGGMGEISMSRDNSSQSVSRQEAKDKVAILSKSSYVRPKHERVNCTLCENHPEGFRGEHELRRHVDREHKPSVKKFVCVIPNDGMSHPEPIVPLTKCKSCQQGKKYGAYYNAAAHLRRTHFNPKPKGRAKVKASSKVEEEKRGGKGGGDWPPMDELKGWMKEVEERAAVTNYTLTEAEQDAADASDEDLALDDGTFDSATYSQHTLSPLSNSPYALDLLHATSPLSTSYLAPTNIEHDIISMQSLPLDLTGATQQSPCMDQSMYVVTSQNNFPVFASEQFPTEVLYFNSPNLPQNIDDQVHYWQ